MDATWSQPRPPRWAPGCAVETNDALAAGVAGIDGDGWSMPGEAPPATCPPGGGAPRTVGRGSTSGTWFRSLAWRLVEEPDEIAGCLLYVAALGPVFALTRGN